VGFILFDVLVVSEGKRWWLRRSDVEDIGQRLGIPCVPIIGMGTLYQAIATAEVGFHSRLGDLQAEGLVVRPIVDLYDRAGGRIIGKIKYKDFAKGGGK